MMFSEAELPRAHLPFEIQCMIVDLNSDDESSLAGYASVCKAWYPMARTYHFKSLRLTDRSGVSARSLLCDSTSSVLPFIRNLIIVEGQKYGNTLWLRDSLPRMRLNELANLESLTLDRFDWTNYNIHARAAVLSLMPRVKKLQLLSFYSSSIRDTLKLLAAAHSLQYLVVTELNDRILHSTTPDSVIFAHTPKFCDPHGLTFLHTNHGALLRTIRCTTSPSHLTNLTVRGIDTATSREVAALLRANGNTLEHLALAFAPFADRKPEEAFIQLGGIRHSLALRTLTLISDCDAYLRTLRQLSSPHIQLVSVALTPHVIAFCADHLAGLGALFLQAPLNRATLRIVVNERDLDVLLGLRRTARERLRALWEEGRMELWSLEVGAGTDTMLEAYEASAERDASAAFRWHLMNYLIP